MKKYFLSLIIFTLLIFCNTVPSNALFHWSTVKKENNNIYTFGKKWYDNKKYFPLRGKMWVYSGDTFGWTFDRDLNIYNENFNVKVKYKANVIKGSGKVKSYSLFRTEHDYGEFDFKYTNKWSNSAYTFEQFFLIDDGTVRVDCKKGCVLKMKIAYTVDKKQKKWEKYIFNIKVKKRPWYLM